MNSCLFGLDRGSMIQQNPMMHHQNDDMNRSLLELDSVGMMGNGVHPVNDMNTSKTDSDGETPMPT